MNDFQEPSDKIHIRDLSVRCIIGVNQWERREKQDILINLCLSLNTRPAAESDDIHQTLNYRSLSKDIIALAESSSFQLLESLVQKIADKCLEYPRAHQVTVCVDKPGALRFCRSVAVEITRKKPAG